MCGYLCGYLSTCVCGFWCVCFSQWGCICVWSCWWLIGWLGDCVCVAICRYGVCQSPIYIHTHIYELCVCPFQFAWPIVCGLCMRECQPVCLYSCMRVCVMLCDFSLGVYLCVLCMCVYVYVYAHACVCCPPRAPGQHIEYIYVLLCVPVCVCSALRVTHKCVLWRCACPTCRG